MKRGQATTAHRRPPHAGLKCRKCGYENKGKPALCNNCRGRFWWIQGRRHRPITGWVGRYVQTTQTNQPKESRNEER